MQFDRRQGILSAIICKENQRGLHLVELMMIATLLAILAAYALPKFGAPASMTLRSQAQQLAYEIRHAQQLAMSTGRRMQVTVQATGANGSYQIACVGSSCASIPTVTVTVGGNVVVGTGPSGGLTFNTLGEPVNGTSGTAPLSFTSNFTLTFNGSTETVSVLPLTGQVKLSP